MIDLVFSVGKESLRELITCLWEIMLMNLRTIY